MSRVTLLQWFLIFPDCDTISEFVTNVANRKEEGKKNFDTNEIANADMSQQSQQ